MTHSVTEAAAEEFFRRGIDMTSLASLKIRRTKTYQEPLVKAWNEKFYVAFSMFTDARFKKKTRPTDVGYWRHNHKIKTLGTAYATHEDAHARRFRDVYNFLHDISSPSPPSRTQQQGEARAARLQARTIRNDPDAAQAAKREREEAETARARKELLGQYEVRSKLRDRSVLQQQREIKTTKRIAAETALIRQPRARATKEARHLAEIQTRLEEGVATISKSTALHDNVVATWNTLKKMTEDDFDSHASTPTDTDAAAAGGDAVKVIDPAAKTEAAAAGPTTKAERAAHIAGALALAKVSDAQFESFRVQAYILMMVYAATKERWEEHCAQVQAVELGASLPRRPSRRAIVNSVLGALRNDWRTRAVASEMANIPCATTIYGYMTAFEENGVFQARKAPANAGSWYAR